MLAHCQPMPYQTLEWKSLGEKCSRLHFFYSWAGDYWHELYVALVAKHSTDNLLGAAGDIGVGVGIIQGVAVVLSIHVIALHHHFLTNRISRFQPCASLYQASACLSLPIRLLEFCSL